MERTDLDLGQLILAVRKNFWKMIFLGMLTGGITFAASYFLLEFQYESSVILHLSNVVYSETLEDKIEVILKLRDSLLDVLKHTDTNLNHGELEKMLSASSVKGTEFIRVRVRSPNPYEAEQLANAIAQLPPPRIEGILQGVSAEVVEYAIPAREPCSPSHASNAILGFLLGIMLSTTSIFLQLICPKEKKLRSKSMDL